MMGFNKNTLPPKHSIPALAVCGRTRYLHVIEAPYNTESLQVGRGGIFVLNIRAGDETACSVMTGRQF